MNDVFDQLRERQSAGNACIGQTATSSGSADADPAVLAAARQVLPALAGLTYEQARAALWLTHSALDLSAVVQAAPIDLRTASEIEADVGRPAGTAELSDNDRDAAREVLLQAFRSSSYGEGQVQSLLNDLKAIKAAR